MEKIMNIPKLKRGDSVRKAKGAHKIMSNFTKIHLTDKQIQVIITALSCYCRLRSGQIGIAMDEAYRDKDISYDERDEIETKVREVVFGQPKSYVANNSRGCGGDDDSGCPTLKERLEEEKPAKKAEFNHPHSYYGFSSPELKDGSLAFEIEKTLTEYLSVKNNEGYWGSGCNFNGPLRTTKEPLPIIEGFPDYRDFPLTLAQTKKILPHYHKNDYKKMWETYDSLKLDLPKGQKYQITIDQFAGDEAQYGGSNERIIVRITKPRKDLP
jgi:hypothetical protein